MKTMKRILFAAMFILGAFQINAQNPQTDIRKVLKFTNDNSNMGTIAYGKPPELNVYIDSSSAPPIP